MWREGADGMQRDPEKQEARLAREDLTAWLRGGRWLGLCRPCPGGETMLLAERFLRVRDREGMERPLAANAAQRAFEQRRGQRNIVLKARQMGITSWVAGRFFLKTVMARGVLTVQVAQTREAAESIFRIVQRFWECLPELMRGQELRRSVANAGRMCFPGLDSEYRVLSASDENAGRGLT